MNKMVKIHLILATIFSISCNSWCTNQNNKINRINVEQSHDRFSLYKQLKEIHKKNNSIIKIFFNAYGKFYDLNYKYNNKIINSLLDKYAEYNNTYVKINDKYKDTATLLGYKPGQEVQLTKLLQDLKEKMNYYFRRILEINNTEQNTSELYVIIKENIVNYLKCFDMALHMGEDKDYKNIKEVFSDYFNTDEIIEYYVDKIFNYSTFLGIDQIAKFIIGEIAQNGDISINEIHNEIEYKANQLPGNDLKIANNLLQFINNVFITIINTKLKAIINNNITQHNNNTLSTLYSNEHFFGSFLGETIDGFYDYYQRIIPILTELKTMKLTDLDLLKILNQLNSCENECNELLESLISAFHSNENSEHNQKFFTIEDSEYNKEFFTIVKESRKALEELYNPSR